MVKIWYIPFTILYTGCLSLIILSLIFLKKEWSGWLLLILVLLLGALILKNSYIPAPSHISKFTPLDPESPIFQSGDEPRKTCGLLRGERNVKSSYTRKPRALAWGLTRFTYYKSKDILLKGTVDSYPKVNPRYTSFVLAVEELIKERKVYRVTGKVWVKLFRKEDISYGQRIILKGKISYHSIFIVRGNTPIKYLGRGKVNPLRALAYRVRNMSGNIFFKYLPSAQAGMLSALILGDRNMIGVNLGYLFIQTGTMHILAISGLHVGIVAFILELFLKVLRLKRHLRYLAIIFLLIFYCFLTGGRPSVVRATIMTIILLIGLLLKRQIQITHSLCLAALIILIVNPQQMFNIGFQLSFVSVISIVYLSPIIRNLLFRTQILANLTQIHTDKSAKIRVQSAIIRVKNIFLNKILRFLTSAFSVSLSAWLGVLPFIAYYFKIISPITVLANLVVVPYIGLIIALGFSLLFVGIIFPILAPIFAVPANLSIVILLQIIKFFNQIPGAYFYL